nr:MAG TPA: hypothetical protein [Caudoviricetes sp.]
MRIATPLRSPWSAWCRFDSCWSDKQQKSPGT